MRILAPSLFLILATTAGAAFASGCTGQVITEGNGKGDDSSKDASPDDAAPGPGPDGSPNPDGGSGPCPTSAPANGSVCTDENLECEYGTSEYPGCDAVTQCESGTWQEEQSGGFCPGINPSQCPSSMAAANGQSCDPGQYGSVSCWYATGGCYCGSLGGPIMVEPDGGYAPQTWQCDDPGPQCPQPRPRIGSTCSDEGLSCQYLECDFAESCTGGIWVSEPEGCAVAGSAPSGP